MKKILCLIFTLILLLAFVGCSDSDTNDTQSTSTQSLPLSGGSSSVAEEGSTSDSSGIGAEEKEPIKEPLSFSIKLDSGAYEGFISGKIIPSEETLEYSLFFGDENGKLEGFTKIPLNDGAISSVVPPSATHLVLEANEELILQEIPKTCLLLDKDAFVFGALSDVHYNKYYDENGNDHALSAFDGALDYFEKIGADMVAVTGDLSNDGEESALTNFNQAISDRSYPVYTVVGNHDMPAYTNGLWEQHITANVKNCEFAPNGVDFIYKPEKAGGDVFVFLNLTRWSYSVKTNPIVRTAQLNWLSEILDQYSENQVYLFFHVFLCGPDGQVHTGVGNIMNPGGYTYPLPYKYANADERIFRRLMKEHKNVVYFSGHSHWMFEMEIYGERANFSSFDGEYCTMVHVPSVTEPRWIGEMDTDRTGMSGIYSQGWTIYDYGDTVILVPMDFITGTFYTEYMEIITTKTETEAE